MRVSMRVREGGEGSEMATKRRHEEDDNNVYFLLHNESLTLLNLSMPFWRSFPDTRPSSRSTLGAWAWGMGQDEGGE